MTDDRTYEQRVEAALTAFNVGALTRVTLLDMKNDMRAALAAAGLPELLERAKKAERGDRLSRTDNRAYDLRQRLDRAVRWLRDAEDIARIEMPAWPTADRIRSIYEQITEDVLNGKTTVEPVLARLEKAERERDELQRECDKLWARGV